MRSDAEETDNHKDVTDSGYSNSCSNSHSQRSGSSKCSGRNSAGSSGSGSSTFCVIPSAIDSGQKDGKDRKDKKKDQDKKGKKKTNKIIERGSSTTVVPILQLSNEEPKFTSGNTCQVNSAILTVPQLMETGTEDNNLQVAALSQTLHSLRKMKYEEGNTVMNKSQDETEIKDKEGPTQTSNVKHLPQGDRSPFEITLEQIASLKSDALREGEICIAVSMLDGVVIFTSGLTHSLGYPNDMWIGRSLIDFIHPKHRASFASFIIQSIAEQHPGNIGMNGQSNIYFCCLRKYRGLKLGFQVTEQNVTYLPCQITLKFKDLPHDRDSSLKECLVVTATPVHSAYKYSDETRMSPKFMTRHSVKCQLIHVDPEVTPYFGFLPQDMLSRSILDFYHPEDMHFLKEVYEAVIKEQGHPFRSKPYRFMCQNGGYALIETELSSFINPWTRKLEFIIGQHSVLRGPSNPDVTTPCSDPKPLNISEEVLKETKIVQEEIKCLLNETVVRSTETAKQQVSKRCKDLAAFMENLMDEITKPPDLKVVVPTEEQSFSERDSVMLGEISPHHDYYDGKSMSETPPSYNQLNYNENIHRFFESKPKTTVSDESSRSGGDNKMGSSGEEGKITPTVNSSSGSKSGDSGDSSGHSTGSNGHSGETTSNDASNNSNNTEGYKPPALTEQLLSRHNEDMEKQMVQKHRVSRTKNDRDSKVKERMKSIEKCQDIKNCNVEEPLIAPQGIKRSGSHSWEGEPYKSIKASHPPVSLCPQQQLPSCVSEPPLLATTAKISMSLAAPPVSSSIADRPDPVVTGLAPTSTVWPPFPVGSPTPVPASPSQEFPGMTLAGGLTPMYYRRPEGSSSSGYPMPTSNPMSYPQPPVHLMSSLLYQPFMYGTPPIQVYSPVMYPAAAFNLNTVRCSPQQKLAASTKLDVDMKPPGAAPVPGTQATTSVETPFTRNQQKLNDENGSNEVSTPYDDSSYQSSFYSFLKTDSKSDESMKSSSENEKLEEQEWKSKKDAKNRPVRKVAPWIENVNVTPDLMLKYQLKERGLEETLKNDAAALEKLKQPSLVNDQLSQMYQDLELEGHSMALNIDEGMTSSSESSGDDTKGAKCSLESLIALKRRKRYMEYDKMTILFEEDAPMPPPIVAQCS